MLRNEEYMGNSSSMRREKGFLKLFQLMIAVFSLPIQEESRGLAGETGEMWNT